MTGRRTLANRAMVAIMDHLAHLGIPSTHDARTRTISVGTRRLAVRAASRRLVRIRIRQGERSYVYHYPGWTWNLHQHGQRKDQPDLWALVAFDEHGVSRDTYLVPNAVIGTTRLTIHLQDTEHGRGNDLRAYRQAWDLVTP